jgi:inner membrane protein YidH
MDHRNGRKTAATQPLFALSRSLDSAAAAPLGDWSNGYDGGLQNRRLGFDSLVPRLDEPVTEQSYAPAPDVLQRTSMAAERTWLAWWRTSLGASAAALAVGRFAPHVLEVSAWPYVVLACCYAALAIGMLLAGAWRQRQLERGVATGAQVALPFPLVAAFTVGGAVLSLITVALVVVQA